jgi:bleomycin hydrolase
MRIVSYLSAGLAVFAALVALAGPLAAQQETTDGKFKIVAEVPRQPVLNQGNAGTCWSFATVSFLEAEVERMTQQRVDLSEIFPVFFTYVAKSKRYVETKGKSQFSQGGLSHDLSLVLREYGIAPQSAYTGLCPGDKRHNHAAMERGVKGFIDAFAKAKSRRGRALKPDAKWEAALQGILGAYLGMPPEKFEVDGVAHTPKSYAESLGLKAENYVEIMSQSSQPMWARGLLDVPDNWERNDQYLNVPIADLMKTIDNALAKGCSVALDCDVSERGFNARAGTATLTEEQKKAGPITDERRGQLFADKKTTDDHLMHIVGVAESKDGERFYIVKNSWGPIGPYSGNVMMSRDFVALKTLAIMVHKDGVPDEVKSKFKL